MAQMTVIAETFKQILLEMRMQTATLRAIEENTRKGDKQNDEQ